MTTHELAKKLLDGPDTTVVLAVECANDTISSTEEDGTPITDIDVRAEDDHVVVHAWVPDTIFGYED